MSVTQYTIRLLQYKDCDLQLRPEHLRYIIKAWRTSHCTSDTCTVCNKTIDFDEFNYMICCNNFYFKPTKTYIIKSLAITTPGFHFLPEALKRTLLKLKIEIKQDFIIIPDPIYWQISSTLVYDRVIKYVLGEDGKKRKLSENVKTPAIYYKQMQNAFLNHGSFSQRSEGKNTYFRKIALAKRCEFTARAMIIPAPFLKANEIIIPDEMEKESKLLKKWIILNRMPSLLPENFVALRVVGSWPHYCFGIPLEIAPQLNADFDGDECNAYIIKSAMAQAECETILNSESNMSSFTMGLKLTPCHDMLVTYYLKYNEIDFLPYKNRNLQKTFKVIYDLYGSQKCFECIDKMRKFYLDKMQNDFLFTLSYQEFLELEKIQSTDLEDFIEKIKKLPNTCLLTQVRSGAKGTFLHLYQLVKSVGLQYFEYTEPILKPVVESSFLKGLTPAEMVVHAQAGFDALINTSEVWRPGYDFFKLSNNLQNLEVNYKGQIVDKDNIIADDALQMLYHEDLMSKESFTELIEQYLKSPNVYDSDQESEHEVSEHKKLCIRDYEESLNKVC